MYKDLIIFPDVRRISSKKSHGLHKICHNSRKNSKLKEGKLETQVKKLKPEGKNSRFRQNQKRGLRKIGRKKSYIKKTLRKIRTDIPFIPKQCMSVLGPFSLKGSLTK